MSIHVKYFASLREQMGRAEESLDDLSECTVADIWARVAGAAPMPANLLMAVNQAYVQAAHVVQDGDEVAFFPPVTGG